MRSLLAKLISRYRWKYVGTVEGMTYYLREGKRVEGEYAFCSWILNERGDGKRRFNLVGRNGGSQESMRREASVLAWMDGGPLPDLDQKPEPPPPAQKADLIVFPGGKGAA